MNTYGPGELQKILKLPNKGLFLFNRVWAGWYLWYKLFNLLVLMINMSKMKDEALRLRRSFKIRRNRKFKGFRLDITKTRLMGIGRVGLSCRGFVWFEHLKQGNQCSQDERECKI